MLETDQTRFLRAGLGIDNQRRNLKRNYRTRKAALRSRKVCKETKPKRGTKFEGNRELEDGRSRGKLATNNAQLPFGCGWINCASPRNLEVTIRQRKKKGKRVLLLVTI